MNHKRWMWIDVAKGISIFFIVLGHVYTNPILRKPIYAFHVPIFFFLAGLVEKNEGKFKERINRAFKSILVPYYLVGIFSIFVFTIVGNKIFILLGRDISNYHNVMQSSGLASSIFGMIYGNSKLGNMQWNLPLWFLTCFFATKLLFFVAEKITKGTRNRRCILLIGLFLYSVVFRNIVGNICMPFQLETALYMLIWYESGYLVKPIMANEKFIRSIRKSKIFSTFLAVLILCASITGAYINGSIQVRVDQYSNVILYYIVACGYIASISIFSVLIENINILQYIGKRTMNILLLHKFPVVFFQLAFTLINRGHQDIFYEMLVGILITVISIGLCIIADNLFFIFRERKHNED